MRKTRSDKRRKKKKMDQHEITRISSPLCHGLFQASPKRFDCWQKEKKIFIYIYTRNCEKHDENWPRYHWEPTLCWSYTCYVRCALLSIYAVYIYYTILYHVIQWNTTNSSAAVPASEKDLRLKNLRILNRWIIRDRSIEIFLRWHRQWPMDSRSQLRSFPFLPV